MYQGSCLCKAVSYEVQGEFDGFFFCHCSRCRKVSGTAHNSNLFSKTATLKWLSGEDSIRVYQVPDTRFSKTFCVNCSSALPTVKKEWLLVPAGSLDCDVHTKPSGHIFVASRANWDNHLEDIPKFDGFPPIK